MPKFKIGQRVQFRYTAYTAEVSEGEPPLKIGAVGTVIENHECPYVVWDAVAVCHAKYFEPIQLICSDDKTPIHENVWACPQEFLNEVA